MLRRIAALVVIALAIGWTFAPARDFAFLNWDDDAVIVRNAALDAPDIGRWAFTTTYMEHYQPLSWLVWAAIKRHAGSSPVAFHTANLITHGLCALLIFAAALALTRVTLPGVTATERLASALAAALLWALHPLRVEVVAWVSAFPYALALAFALLSLIAWLAAAESRATIWWTTAFVLFMLSLLARPIALGLPLVLFVIDTKALGRRLDASVARVWPFTAAAVAAAGVEATARAPGVSDVPWLDRVQLAASAPFVYVWHSVMPARLTPLDVQPAHPGVRIGVLVAALLALTAILALAWKWRRRAPLAVTAMVAYLALLAPAAGLVASGLQATADRYSYLPGVVLSIAGAAAVTRWTGTRAPTAWMAAGAAIVIVAALAVSARQTLASWSDSISLWTRVVSLEPSNDVGLYNLGTALAAAGRNDEAAARYREVLAIEPAHTAARANLDRLEAGRFEREGNDAAARGDVKAAAAYYREAIRRDPARTHSHAGLGMALLSGGQTADAISALREAVRQGAGDPAVSNALAMAVLESGNVREARTILEAALAAHQTDVNLAANLARLLATSPEFARSDGPLALRLARAVSEATGGRDPRALDTLAAALAINGEMKEAAAASARAAALAEAQGDHEMAVQITARGRAYRNPGR